MNKITGVLIAVVFAALIVCSDNPSPESKNTSAGIKPKEAAQLFSLVASAHAETMAAFKKYPMKSGTVTFERDGVIGKSKIIVYFDDYGTKERNEVYNGQGKLEEVMFTDGETMYKIARGDSNEKIVYILGPGKYGTEMKFEAEPFRSEKQKQRKSYTKLPDMEILGKPCQAYSIKSKSAETVFAGWNNVLLYSKVTMKMGDTVTRAVDFKENAGIDPALFKVPADYTVQKI